jgi:hypothetical protein
MQYVKAGALLCAALILLALSITDGDARGRTGSHSIGGVGSHGKGSHYVGDR